MYTMKEACQLCNMTYDTLKFYCNKGLVPNVKRDKNNYRVFDDNNIGWLNSLSCLKKCGMSIEEIKEYLDFCLQGKSTIPKRKVILSQKREALIEQMKIIQESIDYIDTKQQLYDDILDGKIEYQSNLVVK